MVLAHPFGWQLAQLSLQCFPKGSLGTVVTSISLLEKKLVDFVFVGDTDFTVTHDSNKADQVAAQMKSSFTMWEGICGQQVELLCPKNVSGTSLTLSIGTEIGITRKPQKFLHTQQ